MPGTRHKQDVAVASAAHGRLGLLAPRTCIVCKVEDAVFKDRCRTCYEYLRRTGHDRSPDLVRRQARRAGRGEQTQLWTVYRLFSIDRHLLYVGSSGEWSKRITAHTRRPWWPDVALVRLEQFGSRAEMLEAEVRAIRDEQPVYNERGLDKAPAPRNARRAGYAALAAKISR